MRERLRSPVGQMLSVLGLFALAIVVATIMASQRSFFATTVRLKPTSVDVAGAGVKAAARGDHAALRASRALFDNAWDTFISTTVDDRIAATLWQADPDEVCRRLHRTLVAGTDAQRQRAVLFVHLVHDEKADAVLALAREWWARRRANDVVLQLTAP